jgi:hypothetical protein
MVLAGIDEDAADFAIVTHPGTVLPMDRIGRTLFAAASPSAGLRRAGWNVPA